MVWLRVQVAWFTASTYVFVLNTVHNVMPCCVLCAVQIVSGERAGTFLLRPSLTQPGCIIITVKVPASGSAAAQPLAAPGGGCYPNGPMMRGGSAANGGEIIHIAIKVSQLKHFE